MISSSEFGNARVLVTGARGFLGAHVIEQLQACGCEAIAGYRGAATSGAVHLDVRDPSSVEAAIKLASPSHVIHCAAYGVNYSEQDFDTAIEVNVTGTLHVHSTAARYGVQRFVHVGSCFEYGSYPEPISEDRPLNPTAAYGATKAAVTLLLKEQARRVPMATVIARPFGIWGPGEAPHRLVPQVIAACLNRSPLKLTQCQVTRDLAYAEDVAAGIVALALNTTTPNGEIVNLGMGQGIVLQDFVRAVASELAGEELMLFGALPYRSTEMPTLVANVEKMRQLLGMELPQTPLAEGVRRMVARLPAARSQLRA